VPRALDVVFRAPELGARFPRCFGGRHPDSDQVRGAQLDVETEFFPEISVYLTRADDTAPE
jgi:hypothetical protein